MSIAIIELNDSGLHCASGRDEPIVSPGYALLTPQGITTGEAALKRAYLEPQQSFNQYWRQLNLSPLPVRSKVARHHADLAYAQLLQLHQESGSPAQIIFATPGSFDREQLAILLGLAKASPFEATGLVDAAVAAATQAGLSGELLHLDIQLHQAVVTRLYAGGEIERRGVDVLPELGIKSFYDTWAQHIADQFIRQYRYDPLHTAAGEQQLYDRLPGWLAQLSGSQEVGVELDSPQGRYRINLGREQLLASSSQRSQQLQKKLAELRRNGEILLSSHRIGLLPGLSELLTPAKVLPASAVIDGCLMHLERIGGQGEQLAFVTRLPGNGSGTAQPTIGSEPTLPEATTSPASQPSHVLYGHRAYPLGAEGLSIDSGDSELHIRNNSEGAIQLRYHNGQLQLQTTSSNVSCSGNWDDLLSGDSIRVGDQRLELIEVL
ncbi:MAG: hypothetical protein R3E57_02245 [Porticoccaceae bacterium]